MALARDSSDLTFNLPTATSGTTNASTPTYLPNQHFNIFQLNTDEYDKTVFDGTAKIGNVHDATAGTTGGPTKVGVGQTNVEGYLNDFKNLAIANPQLYANLQAELYNAQYYGSKPNWGVWSGDKDANAMKSAVRAYLGVLDPNHPMTISEFLGRSSAQGKLNFGGVGGSGGGGSSRAPLQLTSSASLQEASKTQAQNELGRETDSTEQTAFVNKYHGKEQAAYNGSKETPGDVSSEAKNFIDTSNNAEMQTHLQAGYAQRILSMLGVS